MYLTEVLKDVYLLSNSADFSCSYWPFLFFFSEVSVKMVYSYFYCIGCLLLKCKFPINPDYQPFARIVCVCVSVYNILMCFHDLWLVNEWKFYFVKVKFLFFSIILLFIMDRCFYCVYLFAFCLPSYLSLYCV